jgi:hypothetical protein
VPNFGLVTRIHVLTAIRTADELGAAAFLGRYAIEGPTEEVVVERGRRYDPRALLIFAYEKATGTRLAPEDLPADAASVLKRLDFRVVPAEAPADAPAKRTPRVRKPKVAAPAKPEPVVNLCPRCMMQLPASGQCDYCD